jgi:hypothetical protein
MSEELPIPAKTELTVLQADAPEKRTLGFVVYERQGVSLYPIIEGKIGEEPVPETEDLVVGRDYTACGLMSEDLLWTVGKDAYGELTITCGPSLIGILERGGDDRNCWRVTGMVNARGVTKLDLKSS